MQSCCGLGSSKLMVVFMVDRLVVMLIMLVVISSMIVLYSSYGGQCLCMFDVRFLFVMWLICVLISWIVVISGYVSSSDYSSLKLNCVFVCEYVLMLEGLLLVVLVIRLGLRCWIYGIVFGFGFVGLGWSKLLLFMIVGFLGFGRCNGCVCLGGFLCWQFGWVLWFGWFCFVVYVDVDCVFF